MIYGLDFEGINHVTLLAGPSGGTHEMIAAGVAEILGRSIPTVRFTAIATAGLPTNPTLLMRGEGEVGVSTGDSAATAVRGVTPFTEPHLGLRGMFGYYPNTWQMWARHDSGITTFDDLRTRRFSFGLPGAGPFQPMMQLLNMLEWTQADIDSSVVMLPWGESLAAIRDNTIQAILWTTSFPIAGIIDVQTTLDVRLIEIEPAIMQRFKALYDGWIDVTIPAGVYRHQYESVQAIGSPNFYAVWETLPEDLVYAMTRALWENREAIGMLHVQLRDLDIDTVTRTGGVPLHPGARRFWETQGVYVE